MPSCEIYGSRFACRLTYNLSQNIGGNYSVIRITKVELKSLQSMPTTECWVLGSISVNGSNACTLELTGTTSCSVTMNQSYHGGGEGNGWFSGFSTRDVVIGHGEDGNGGFSVYASLDVIMTNQIGLDPGIRNSTYVGLPQIPRVSSLSAGGVELGQEMTLRISRASSAFSDTVTWRCGGLSGTIADRTTAAELRWTPAVDLAAQAPNSTTVYIELTIQTFVNGSQVGSRAIGVNCTVPGWVVPTVTAVVWDRMGYTETYGGYVQSQSQARIVTTAAGVYGSTIRSIAARCGGLTGSGADVSFSLGDSGEVPITVTVTDSRGRTAQWASSIQVLPYRKPQAAVTQAYRCDSEGNPQPDGVWLRVVFDGSITTLTGNSATYRGVCRVHGGDEERSVLLADYTGQTAVTGGSFLLTAGLDSGYDCYVTVQDNFSTVQSPGALVSVAFALLDFDRADKAVGIGMRAKNPGKVSIGLDVNMEEHRLGNLLDPEENQDAATKFYVDTAEAANAYTDAAFRKAAPRNLLDNSDFRNPVNQRGQTSYSGDMYTIDRWFAGSSVNTVTVNNGYITVTPESGNWGFFNQKLENKVVFGKKLTLAVKVKNGDLIVVSGQYPTSAPSSNTVLATVTSGSVVIYIEAAADAGLVIISATPGSSINLEWAALYEGEYTAETLPEYHPKGYGAELAECQRYYRTLRIIFGTAIGAPDRQMICFAPTMRIAPTAFAELYKDGSDPNATVTINSVNAFSVDVSASSWGSASITLNAEL